MAGRGKIAHHTTFQASAPCRKKKKWKRPRCGPFFSAVPSFSSLTAALHHQMTSSARPLLKRFIFFFLAGTRETKINEKKFRISGKKKKAEGLHDNCALEGGGRMRVTWPVHRPMAVHALWAQWNSFLTFTLPLELVESVQLENFNFEKQNVPIWIFMKKKTSEKLGTFEWIFNLKKTKQKMFEAT